MKKILMGLLAVSAIAFSAINMNTPKDETNVFELGQTGKLLIKSTVKSKLAPVKYVVFADTDGNWSGDEEDIWTLPTILLSQASLLNKFSDDVPLKNVYVKSVNGSSNGVEQIPTGKNVKFKVVLDTQYTGITSNPFGNSGKFAVNPTALMTAGSLKTLIQGLSGATVNENGEIVKDAKVYRTPNNVKFFSDANGVLKATMEESNSFANSETMQLADAKEVEKLFNAAQPFTALKVEITVE